MTVDNLKTDVISNVQVRGKVLKIVREQYLRRDISCRSSLCSEHQDENNAQRVGSLPTCATHYLIPFYDVALKYLEVLEIPDIHGIIFLQSVVTKLLHEAGKRHYLRVLEVVRDMRKGCALFLNEIHQDTHLDQTQHTALAQWLNQSVFIVARWYYNHLNQQIPLVLITEDARVLESFKDEISGIFVMSLEKYLKEFWSDLTSAHELYESISASLLEDTDDCVVGPQESKLFARHWTQEQANVGLKSGRLLEGQIQVSRNWDTAYVTHTDSTTKDSIESVLIPGGKYRNRAVHGDRVAVEILPEAQWEKHQRGKCQRVGRVVGILQRNWRDYVATFPEDLQDGGGRGGRFVLVTPYDRRIPRVRIRTTRSKELANQRVVIRLDKWEWDSQYPQGHLVKPLGLVGNLETELEALLIEHSVPVLPFSAGVVSELPNGDTWQVEEQEELIRRDLRDHLAFSIDPKGCQDVDDVLSIRQMESGIIELGVHIADVCHFVKPLTLVDLEARARATSVYLADRRFDMLPPVLSTDLCSLRSLCDRYAVSVIWKMDSQTGNVLDAWFGRTIVRSSYQLSYETAQDILEGKGLRHVLDSIPELKDYPEDIREDRFEELCESLQQLRHLSRCLQFSRYQQGALQFDSIEVQFEFEQDSVDGQQAKAPKPKQHLEVHETVAECMIAANHWVAEKIMNAFPQQALLRLHPPPRPADLEELCSAASKKGFELSTTSNKELAKSLDQAVITADPAINTILRLLGTRAMSEAHYVSTGSHSELFHYGLGLDTYTHFTSPIRRYADIIVHRLLLASCADDNNPGSEVKMLANQDLEELCKHLNNKHRAAQQVQKASSELFQALYFQRLSPSDPSLLCQAIVYGIRQKGLVALVPSYGLKGSVRLADSKGQVAHLQEGTGIQWMQGQVTLDPDRQSITVAGLQVVEQTYHLFDHLLCCMVALRCNS